MFNGIYDFILFKVIDIDLRIAGRVYVFSSRNYSSSCINGLAAMGNLDGGDKITEILYQRVSFFICDGLNSFFPLFTRMLILFIDGFCFLHFYESTTKLIYNFN